MTFIIKEDTQVITTVTTMVLYRMHWLSKPTKTDACVGQEFGSYIRIFHRRLSAVEIAKNARSRVSYFGFKIVTTRLTTIDNEVFSKMTEEGDMLDRYYIDPMGYYRCRWNGVLYVKTRTGVSLPRFDSDMAVRTK